MTRGNFQWVNFGVKCSMPGGGYEGEEIEKGKEKKKKEEKAE